MYLSLKLIKLQPFQKSKVDYFTILNDKLTGKNLIYKIGIILFIKYIL